MKVLQLHRVRLKMGSSHLLSNGDVRAAICPKKRYHPHTAAGARRNWIPKLFLVYLHIHVDKHAADRRLFPSHVLIHAI